MKSLWVYCNCGNDLTEGDSFVSDTCDENGDNHVRYKCSECGLESDFNFDIAPVPVNWNQLKKLFVVDMSLDEALCPKCSHNLFDFNNFKYKGVRKTTETYTEELCFCKTCGSDFVMKYNLFDSKGHIDSKIFSGDINDPSYNWLDNLSKKQISKISDHIKNCNICKDRLEEVVLRDAWFASLFKKR